MAAAQCPRTLLQYSVSATNTFSFCGPPLFSISGCFVVDETPRDLALQRKPSDRLCRAPMLWGTAVVGALRCVCCAPTSRRWSRIWPVESPRAERARARRGASDPPGMSAGFNAHVPAASALLAELIRSLARPSVQMVSTMSAEIIGARRWSWAEPTDGCRYHRLVGVRATDASRVHRHLTYGPA